MFNLTKKQSQHKVDFFIDIGVAPLKVPYYTVFHQYIIGLSLLYTKHEVFGSKYQTDHAL